MASAGIWWLNQQQKISRFLPSEASEINEEFFGSVDYAKYMRAKISQEGFEIFRERIGYTKVDLILSDAEGHFGWYAAADDVGDWWNPSSNIIGAYGRYDEEQGSIALLKYENGYVYHTYHKW